MVKKIVNFFTSTKLTIILLILLLIGLFFGTIIPQGGSDEQYLEAFSHGWYIILNGLDFFDVYNSIWFIALGVLLLVNLVACSIDRIILDLRKRKNPVKGPIEVSVSDDKLQNIPGIFKELGYRYNQPTEAVYIARKGVPIRLFSIIFHLVLVLFAVGIILSVVSRFDDTIYLSEGDTQRIPYSQTDSFDITLEKFEMEYEWYRDGYFPKDYISYITTSLGHEKRIEVNKPFKYHGLTVYQFEYEQKFDLLVGDTIISVTSGEYFRIPGVAGEFKTATVYLGTLYEDGDPKPIEPSTKLYYKGTRDEKPGESRMEEQMIGKLFLNKPFRFGQVIMMMHNVKPVSGLFYRKDSGYPVIFYSLIIFMLALFARVFIPGYKVTLYRDKENKAVYLSGKASGIFGNLDRKIDQLKTSLGE